MPQHAVRRANQRESLKDHLCRRLRLLGATDVEVAGVTSTWDEPFDDDGEPWTEARKFALASAPDSRLLAELASARADYPYEPPAPPTIRTERNAVVMGVSPLTAPQPAGGPQAGNHGGPGFAAPTGPQGTSGGNPDVITRDQFSRMGVRGVLEWATGDKGRARAAWDAEQALAAEQGRKPRKSLMDRLEMTLRA